MIVYKFHSYRSSELVRGLVSSESAKQYKVFEEDMWDKGTWSKMESTWRKSDCFATIESASEALIAKAERDVIMAHRNLDRAKSSLDVARKWVRREAEELAKLPTTQNSTTLKR